MGAVSAPLFVVYLGWFGSSSAAGMWSCAGAVACWISGSGSSAVATSCLWFFGVIRSLLFLISFVFLKLIFSCLARGGII